MAPTQASGHENIDQLPNQLVTFISEQPLGLRINQNDQAVAVDHDKTAWGSLDREPKLFLHEFLLGRIATYE